MSTVTDIRDFAGAIGCFFMLTREGKLDAIEELYIGADCDQYRVELSGLNLGVLSPLVAGVRRSNLLAEVSRGPTARVQYLMRLTMGDRERTMPALGSVEELITRSLDTDCLPILVQSELDEVMGGRRPGAVNSKSAQIPLRGLSLRGHLPREVAASLRALAIANTRDSGDKRRSLRPYVVAVRKALRETVLCDYMMKCIWLDQRSSQIGNLLERDDGVEFEPFDADNEDITQFLCALDKDAYGDFLLDFREFANVLPTPKRSNPWLGPTVHVYKPEFRAEHDLDEYYSLYAGFRALSAIGAPVLIYAGQNPLIETTPIRFLKVSDRSLNVLQGRILEGNVLQEGVREFTAQELVWHR